MNIDELRTLLSGIHGCTFAALDAETFPSPGIKKIVRNERVLLYAMKEGSGYENAIRKRLLEIKKDPDSFSVGDLPWGERRDNLPLIYHRGKVYLQTILLQRGTEDYFIGRNRVAPEDIAHLLRSHRPQPFLPEGRQVYVQTYCVDSISAIRLMGEELKRERRPKLSLRLPAMDNKRRDE